MSSASRRSSAWLIWLALVVACGVGLRWYRVDNGIDGWAAQKAAMGDSRSYVVVGGPGEAFGRVAGELRTLPMVGRTLDPHAAALLRPFGGPTPDHLVINGNWSGGFYFAADGVSDSALVAAVRQVVDREPSLHVAGPAVYHVALGAASQARMPLIAAAIAVVGFFGVRLCGFAWRFAGQALAVVVGSQVALLGAMSWCGIAVDATASMAPPLMAALGYSLVLHRAAGAGVGLLLGCYLTTAAAAASVAVAPVGPLRQFGLVALCGLTLTALGTWLLVARGASDKSAARFSTGASPLAWSCVAVLLVAGLACVGLLHVDADGVALLPANARERVAFEQLDAHLTGMLPSQVICQPPVPRIAERLDASPAVTKVVDASAADGLPRGSRFWVLSHNDALPELYSAMRELQSTAPAGASIEWRGLAAQLAAAEAQVARVAKSAMPTALAITAIAAFWATRSLRAMAAAVFVAGVPSAALVATLACLGIALTPPHLLVFAIATGVAADDVLHVCRAWATGHGGGWRRACLASSAVSVACLLPLLASPFPPARQFAWMLAIALSVASPTAVFLLPRLLPALPRRRRST